MENLQNINWDNIKGWILDNTKEIFHPINASFNEIINMFFYLLKVPIEDESLNGIPQKYPIALQRIIVEGVDKPSHFQVLARIEGLLRKILFIVNRMEYEQQKDDRDGLCKVVDSLGLNKNQINLNWETLRESQKSYYSEHLLHAYQLRNIESHYCESMGDVKLLLRLIDVIIVYLFAIDEYYVPLKKWAIMHDGRRNAYLKKVETEFKEWNSRFVPIIGREQFNEVALYAVEVRSDMDKPREGEVEQLRNQLSAARQNQMIIVGEAGLGKTTSMKYMALRDARQDRIPIYVELKLLTTDMPLREVIIRKLQLVSDDIENLTQSSSTCIFLDGLNEVQPMIKSNTINEIKKIIAEFPKVFFIISTRPQDYKGEFGSIPVFSLQKMDIGKIRDFLKRNTTSENVQDIILKAMKENREWVSILGTPLILFMLIRVVSKDGTLPDDKNKIVLRFIKLLYEREREKDHSFDSQYFHGIICLIAFESVKLNGTNSALSFPAIKLLLQDSANISDKDLRIILQKAVELNILVQDGVLYSYSHQQYQDTLAGDYANTLFSL